MEQRLRPPENENGRTGTRLDRAASAREDRQAVIAAGEPVSKAEQAAELGARLSTLVDRHAKRSRRAVWAVPVFYGLMAVAVLLGKALLGDERWAGFVSGPFMLVPVLFFWAATTGLFIDSLVRPRKERRRLTEALAGLNDVRGAGALVDALSLEDGKARRIAMDALTGLLPRLKPTDAELLNARQRAYLCGVLSNPLNRYTPDADCRFRPPQTGTVAFRIAILQAFAQVGGRTCLPAVERLAAASAGSEGEKQVREAARHCLPALKARVEQVAGPRTLLRAADSAASGPDDLLRAATGRPEPAADQLLRPGSAPPADG